LVDQDHVEAVGKLRRSAEGRSVPLPGTHQPNDEIITLLAAGFARGEKGSPAIPYARLEG
ncbi:MAG: BrxE family protein, partial [Chromatiaceae bacterium]